LPAAAAAAAAAAQVFGRQRSGQGTGTIGKLTNGHVTREDYYAHVVQMALVPFLNPELYPDFAVSPPLS
jgi:non-canonical (house-cleaning) NTP pyrophosphatase